MENDPFEKIALNNETSVIEELDSHTKKWSPSTAEMIMNYTFIVFGSAKFFLALGVVVADILLIYLILRYKRLRKDLNLYIVHYAIMNLSYYLVTPIFSIVHALFASGYSYFLYFYCNLGMIEVTLVLMSFLYITLLGLDWTLSSFRPNYMRKINIFYVRKFKILFVLFVILLVINCFSCALEYEFGHDVLAFTMPLFIIALVAMHYLRRKKVLSVNELKTEYSLWICTIAVGCYIPIYILDWVFRFYTTYNSFVLFLIFLEYTLSLIATPGPIFILYYLLKWNKHFKMAYDITFKASVRTYGADNLDDASDNEDIVGDETDKNVQSNSNGTDTTTIMVP